MLGIKKQKGNSMSSTSEEIRFIKQHLSRLDDVKDIVYALLEYLDLDYKSRGSVFKIKEINENCTCDKPS